jgi:DNA-binding GntR family transcriptional regulator
MGDMPPRERQRPYERMLSDLRRRLQSGEWQPGDHLPTVAEFASRYDTSTATVSKVLKILADEGLIEVIPRWGTFKT